MDFSVGLGHPRAVVLAGTARVAVRAKIHYHTFMNFCDTEMIWTFAYSATCYQISLAGRPSQYFHAVKISERTSVGIPRQSSMYLFLKFIYSNNVQFIYFSDQ